MTNMVYVVYCDDLAEPVAIFKDHATACTLCDKLEAASYGCDYWVADLPILYSVEEYKND